MLAGMMLRGGTCVVSRLAALRSTVPLRPAGRAEPLGTIAVHTADNVCCFHTQLLAVCQEVPGSCRDSMAHPGILRNSEKLIDISISNVLSFAQEPQEWRWPNARILYEVPFKKGDEGH